MNDKEDVINIYIMEYYSAIKKWKFAICDNTDGSQGNYGKWNKSEKVIYCVISLKCGIKKKTKQMNITKQKQL